MWTEQIPLADGRLDVSATTSGGSPGMSLTVVRHGRMEGDARIAGQSEALLLLGTIAEAVNHMGWLSDAGRSLVASVVLAEGNRTVEDVDALEEAAASDGPRRLQRGLRTILFYLAWPNQTPHVRTTLGIEVEAFEDALASAQSVAGSVDLGRSWRLARLDIIGLGMPAPLEACPWPDIAAVLSAAGEVSNQ